MHLFLRVGLLLLALAIALPACGGGSETAECQYCIEEDFASTESATEDGWPIESGDVREYSVVDGEYVATLKQHVGVLATSRFPGPDIFDITDSKVSVTGRATAGEPVLGLYCRQSGSGATFQAYGFGVLEDRYSINAYVAGKGASLERGPLPEGTDLTQPTTLEVSCKGDEFVFAVNGTTVTTIQDSRVPAGANGVLLAANADAQLPVTVVYDDFEIAEADE